MKGLDIGEIIGNVCPVFPTISLFSNFDLFVFIFTQSLQTIDVTKEWQQVTTGKKPTVLLWKKYFWMLNFLKLSPV